MTDIIIIGSICDYEIGKFQFFDLHENFGFAGVLTEDGKQKLYVNGRLWADWEARKFLHLYRVKWIDQAHVILWLAPGGSIIVSSRTVTEASIGNPSGIMISDGVIFVAYSDEAVMSARRDEYEFDMVAAFSEDLKPICGFASLAYQKAYEETILVIGYYYARRGMLICLAYDSEYLWIFDPRKRTLRRTLLGSILYANVAIILGDDELCWLFVESDSHKLSATAFDLKSGQKMHEFANVADHIARQGFDHTRLSFKDGYDGKIIISDGQRAGILEMSV